MAINTSYFLLPSLGGLFSRIDRWLNPYHHRGGVVVRGAVMAVRSTHRAERALSERSAVLTVELQLYFSCVVKKRVLFHSGSEPAGTPFGERLNIVFRLVESASCDPEAFANYFPEKRELASAAARKVHPSVVALDYRKGRWWGEFTLG